MVKKHSTKKDYNPAVNFLFKKEKPGTAKAAGDVI